MSPDFNTPSIDVRTDREFVLSIVAHYALAIEHTQSEFERDKELMLVAAKQNAMTVFSAERELRKEILLENPVLLECQGLRKKLLRLEPSMVSEILEDLPVTIQKFIVEEEPSELQRLDFTKQCAIIDEEPKVVRHLKVDLQRHVVSDYLDKIDRALEIKLQTLSDEELARNVELGYSKYVLSDDPYQAKLLRILEHVDDEMKNDRALMQDLVIRCSGSLEYASPRLRGCREIFSLAISRDKWAIAHATEGLRDDVDIMMTSVRRNGSTLQYASNALKSNKELVLIAVMQDPRAIQYASEHLKSDQQLVFESLKGDLSILAQPLSKINIVVKPETSKDIITAVRRDPQILNSVTNGLFKEVTNKTITMSKALLRESIIAKIFFKKCGLYLTSLTFVRFMQEKYIDMLPYSMPADCIDNILGFIFTRYDFEKVEIAGLPMPIKSSESMALDKKACDATVIDADDKKCPEDSECTYTSTS